jgi:hypothetical protein
VTGADEGSGVGVLPSEILAATPAVAPVRTAVMTSASMIARGAPVSSSISTIIGIEAGRSRTSALLGKEGES